ncbi:polysaccharide biosynthesis protein [Nonlabens dokdonensis]|uniref:UDP-N-acetylglucosamine 4, 6-dehydratase n=2 Tax=Nonlabens dokdonensis TaxID=328515 RepID=L7WEX8_NONDD|nr:UDP-N-acetylglucosamine 4,6-dehydratase [Nonlabens dokdonensis]AGC78684.1 UDP-N-acetylglucosamine 4, 6-dehydratase [Nonlabens dokdonensis DSW-6]PZX39189.1 polysaccharide biosynthesis protein [Nonlabens dokdonensis]
MNILNLIGRNHLLFKTDIEDNEKVLSNKVGSSSFLVLGGAGSIGQAVVKEIFKRNPVKLHVVDISENNMVELVRDIRSSIGYIDGDFQTFALDIGSVEYDAFIEADGQYDYVLNLSALKHVRSEKDPFTLMRMINVNIFNTYKSIQQSVNKGVKKYFCVSTDKAANPVNMMGASKRIMEMFIMKSSQSINISTARFANVAFSDGSLLHGFNKRIEKLQPIVAPTDVTRYFVVPQEAGELCLMSCILGDNRDIFFPDLKEGLDLISFADIAINYLKQKGYEPFLCDSEQQARDLMVILPKEGKWPCYFTVSDTTGEKPYEEFYTENEIIDLDRFENLGVIKNEFLDHDDKINNFENAIDKMQVAKKWQKSQIVDLFKQTLPNFVHEEKGKFLDSKM